MNVDIAVIGAGLAGLSSALAAKTKCHDAKVVIFEACAVGANNPTPLTFTDIIDRYDLDACTVGRYSEFCFYNNGGSSVTYRYGDGRPLLSIDYQHACNIMLDRLRKLSDYDPLVMAEITAFHQQEDTVALYTDNGEEIVTQLMVDCSGKRQLTASQLAPNGRRLFSHVYGAKFRNVNSVDPARAFYLLPHKTFGSGGGWLYPLNDKCASFGFAMISEGMEYTSKECEEKFIKAVSLSDLASKCFSSDDLIHYESGSIPVSYIPRFVFDRIIIAGDAGGMATSWTCMGVESALVYGEMAGRYAAEALLMKMPNRLNEMQRQWDLHNRRSFDKFAGFSETFWKGDYSFWEWVVKNDLRYLNSGESIERMRWNKHLIGPFRALFRTGLSGILSKLRPALREPVHFYR